MDDPAGVDEYVNIVHHCFDVYLSMGILRLQGGCDFSQVIGQEEQVGKLEFTWTALAKLHSRATRLQ